MVGGVRFVGKFQELSLCVAFPNWMLWIRPVRQFA